MCVYKSCSFHERLSISVCCVLGKSKHSSEAAINCSNTQTPIAVTFVDADPLALRPSRPHVHVSKGRVATILRPLRYLALASLSCRLYQYAFTRQCTLTIACTSLLDDGLEEAPLLQPLADAMSQDEWDLKLEKARKEAEEREYQQRVSEN